MFTRLPLDAKSVFVRRLLRHTPPLCPVAFLCKEPSILRMRGSLLFLWFGRFLAESLGTFLSQEIWLEFVPLLIADASLRSLLNEILTAFLT